MGDLWAKITFAGPWLFGGLLIFLRLAACLSMLPELGARTAPARTRLGLTLLIAFAIDSALGMVAVPLPGVTGIAIACGREVLIGALLGFALRLVNATVQMAGDLVGLSMGLSLSTLFDMSSGEAPNALGRLFGLIASMMFLALGGHLIVVGALFDHFQRFPVGEAHVIVPSIDALAAAGGLAIRTAVVLAAPVIAVTLMLNVAMGFVMRVVPAMNLFNIGIGLLLIGGFLALGLESEAIRIFLDREVDQLPLTMLRLAGIGH